MYEKLGVYLEKEGEMRKKRSKGEERKLSEREWYYERAWKVKSGRYNKDEKKEKEHMSIWKEERK